MGDDMTSIYCRLIAEKIKSTVYGKLPAIQKFYNTISKILLQWDATKLEGAQELVVGAVQRQNRKSTVRFLDCTNRATMYNIKDQCKLSDNCKRRNQEWARSEE